MVIGINEIGINQGGLAGIRLIPAALPPQNLIDMGQALNPTAGQGWSVSNPLAGLPPVPPTGGVYASAYPTYPANPMPSPFTQFVQQRFTGTVDENYDVTQNSGVTAADIDKILETKGALAGQGETFIRLGQKYGIDPAFLVGIAINESGHGKCSGHNNAMGIMDTSTGMMTIKRFARVEDSLEYGARNLRENYIDKGLTTIARIQKKYCPVGAANDPKGFNKHWLPKVTEWTGRVISGNSSTA